eukprot:SAG11_NODE_257_length_11556_cov_8.547176_9_plen_144_part_00
MGEFGVTRTANTDPDAQNDTNTSNFSTRSDFLYVGSGQHTDTAQNEDGINRGESDAISPSMDSNPDNVMDEVVETTPMAIPILGDDQLLPGMNNRDLEATNRMLDFGMEVLPPPEHDYHLRPREGAVMRQGRCDASRALRCAD